MSDDDALQMLLQRTKARKERIDSKKVALGKFFKKSLWIDVYKTLLVLEPKKWAQNQN